MVPAVPGSMRRKSAGPIDAPDVPRELPAEHEHGEHDADAHRQVPRGSEELVAGVPRRGTAASSSGPRTRAWIARALDRRAG